MTTKINFKILASALECPRMEVADRDELDAKLNYPPQGVSPLGVEGYPVFIDETLMNHPSVLVGSGTIGVEIELEPVTLVRLCSAQLKPLG